MAIEFCSEKSADIRVSPRISFSYGFCQSDNAVPAASEEEEEQQHPLRSNSNIEFDFCVRESFELESSSADELFSDGKILPAEIKKKTTTASSASPGHQVLDQPPLPPPPQARGLPDDGDDNNNNNNDKNKSLKKYNEGDDKQSSKSFWRFKRSSSCGNGYGRSLCPLPLLSRSNSTGSADSTPIAKRSSSSSSSLSKDVKHNSNRNLKLPSQSSSSNGYQKPPLLKKGGHHHGSYTNGVSINPVLNVPPANLFGLGSIFSNGKEKGKKK